MDKQQAQNLIKETFENPFDKERFAGFVKNLLNRVEEATFTYQGKYIPEKFRQYIKTLERIGKFSDGENSLDILIITLQKETSLERARTRQRNFIAWYLNGSRGDIMKDAALVAFVSPGEADWRFSLVKMDYRFEEGKDGKVKVEEKFTPARRWSFLVGSNEASHTAQSRLVNILADDEHKPTLKQLEEAFNIETVTREFFLKYRELFIRTKEALDKVVEQNATVKADFDAKGVNTVNFAKKLLGQIVFLYFLQKKGWFGVERDAEWGTGSKHFLRELFEGKHGKYTNFFNDILEPLFYEALRIDRHHDDDYYSRFNCKIPFLNGGLFDPIGNYDWVHTDIIIPNELFSNTVKTKEGDTGNGILDIFDRYNFTVKEDELLEKEVAIDPELLGKAYEKFNAIRPDNFEEYKAALKNGKKGAENKFNKKFGVYYTPREIVHYMCQQSLINYLFTRAEEAGLSEDIKKQDIEDLIVVGEMIAEHEATALIKQEQIKNGIQKSTEYAAHLSDSIRKNAATIDKWLADITVCDPAVGSGAFPVGMMHEIVRARNTLSVFLNDSKRNDYEFKRCCIEHSLYGVDIDPGAVEIAKLRLWLSLLVDEEDIKNIKPLPNLDYRIMQGNSLISEFMGINFDTDENKYLKEEISRLEIRIMEIDKEIKGKENKQIEFYNKHQKQDRVLSKELVGLAKDKINIKNRIVKLKAEIEKNNQSYAEDAELIKMFSGKKDEFLNESNVLQKAKLREEIDSLLIEIFETKLKRQKADFFNRLKNIENKYSVLPNEKQRNEIIEQEKQKIYKETGFDLETAEKQLKEFTSGKQIKPFFLWNLYFSEVFHKKGGFDVVIANPPYGADLRKIEINNLIKNYNYFDRQKNSASFFLELAVHLCGTQNGSVSYIVPKSLSYSEGWKSTRNLISIKNQLASIVDVSKAFENVLLEQIIVCFKTKRIEGNYRFAVGEGWHSKVNIFSNLNSSLIKELDILPVYVDSLKKFIYLKMVKNAIPLSEISDTFRGLPAQRLVSKKGKSILRGKNVGKYSIYGNIDKIPHDKNDNKAKRILQTKIVSQNIVAHVANPVDRIIIMATIDTMPYLTFDTVMNTIISDKKFDIKYILAIINSTLASWFYYWFVYNRAIRTMHFDKYYIGKLPIKAISATNQEPFIELVDKILAITKDDDYLQNPQKQAKVKALEREIDQMVYQLYGLTEEEIRIVEGER